MKQKYKEYLNSKRWKVIRKEKLESVYYICEKCKKDIAYQIHHKNYDNLGNEELKDLFAVCKRCHLILEIEKIDKKISKFSIIDDIQWCINQLEKKEEESKKEFIKLIIRRGGNYDLITRSIWFYPLIERGIGYIIPEFWDNIEKHNWFDINCYIDLSKKDTINDFGEYNGN